VIPTFIIDEPFLVFLGILAGSFVPAKWQGSLFRTRAFLAGSFLSLGFMALAWVGYWKAPDWMFMYFIPASKVPLWIVVYLFIFYYLLFLAGFFLHRELKKLNAILPWIAGLLFLAGSVAVVLPLLKEYQTIATFEEFHRGLGVSLPESAVGKATTIPAIILAVVGLILCLWARKQKVNSLVP